MTISTPISVDNISSDFSRVSRGKLSETRFARAASISADFLPAVFASRPPAFGSFGERQFCPHQQIVPGHGRQIAAQHGLMMFGGTASESLQLVEHPRKSRQDRLAVGLGIERGKIRFELPRQVSQLGPIMCRQLARVFVGLPVGTQFKKQIVIDVTADECRLNSVAEESPQRLSEPPQFADKNRLARTVEYRIGFAQEREMAIRIGIGQQPLHFFGEPRTGGVDQLRRFRQPKR